MKITSLLRSLRALPVLVAFSLVVPAGAAAIENAQDVAARPVFRIGVGDVLNVFIYEDNANHEVVVRPDGRITIPLAGDIEAEGTTPAELGAKIRAQLEPYQKNPTVTVSVRTINSYRVYVLGNVNEQQMVQSAAPLRVLQALAMAGGLNEFANKDVIIIRERRDAPPQRIKVEYGKIIRGSDLDLNIWLEPGDVVVAQ